MKKKGKVVVCNRCKSAKYVYQTNTNEKAGAVIGGSCGLLGGINRLLPKTACLPVEAARGVLTVLSCCYSGASIGKAIGGSVDDYVAPRYRCGKCRITIKDK